MFFPKELQRKFVAEMWLYQDGSRILELSTKALPREAFQVAAEARAYLVSKGVDLSGVQQTKTRTALNFFKNQLKAAAKKEASAAAAAAKASAPKETAPADEATPASEAGPPDSPPESSPA